MRKSVDILVLLVLLTIPVTLSAQTTDYGRIGLYTDTSSEIFVEPFQLFDVYVYVQPGNDGLFCTEYALEYGSNLTITGYQSHPDVAVEMGNFVNGISSCMDDCVESWTLMHRISFISVTSDPSSIRVVRHHETRYPQTANCLDSRDIEPVFAYPSVCVNQACMQDEEPPAVMDITILSGMEILLQMSERVFLPDVENLANYLIYMQNDNLVVIPVVEAELRGDDDRIWLLLGSPPGDEECVLELSRLRDMAGNAVPPGTIVGFNEADTTPPLLENAWSVDDSTVVVVFNEQVTPASASDAGNYSVAVQGAGETVPVESTQLEVDSITVVLYLGRSLERGVVHEVTAIGISDKEGNILSTYTRSFMSIDDVRPLLSGVFVDTEPDVRVVYNEAMDPGSVGDPGNYSIFRSDDPSSVSTIDATSSVGNSSIILNLTNDLESETLYSLAVSGVMDSSMNVIATDTFEFSYPDTLPPAFLGAIPIDGITVELTFDEELDPAVAMNTANYVLYVFSNPSVTLQIDAAELMSGAMTVRLHLGEQMNSQWMYTVIASNLADLLDNTMQTMQGWHFNYYERIPPAVTSVAVKSIDFLRVEFSEPLEDESAGDPVHYVIFEQGDSTAGLEVVSADQDYAPGTVTLRTAHAFSDDIFYELRVSGVQDLAGNLVDSDTSYVFIGRDEVQPELVDYSIVSERAVSLTFDEAMDDVSVVDKRFYSVYVIGDPSARMEIDTIVMQDGRSIRIELVELPLLAQVYTLQIVYVMDAAFNVVVPTTIDIVFNDEFPPELTGAAARVDETVRLDFSEPLDVRSATDIDNYSVYLAGYPSMTVAIIGAERIEDGSVVILQLGESLPTGTYSVSATGISDVYGNTMLNVQTAMFAFEDQEPPYVTDITVEHMLEVHVTFSEPLDMAGVDDGSNYTFFTAGDTAVNFFAESARMGDELTVVTLKPVQPLSPGLFYLLRGAGLSDLSGNWIDPDTLYEFFASDSAPPELAGYVTSGDSALTLTFSEPLAPATVTEPGSITISESGNPLLTLAIDLTGLTEDGRVVTVTLVDHAAMGVSYALGIAGIEDLAGNAIVPMQEEIVFSGGADDPPFAYSAEAVGHNELVVHFDKQLERLSSQMASNYYVYTTVDPLSVRDVLAARLLADGFSVHLTVDRNFLNNLHITVNISGVRDIYGNTIEAGSGVELFYTDHFPPGFDAATYLSDRRIRVLFDELADSATSVVPEHYIVYRSGHPDLTVVVDHVEYLGHSVVLNMTETLSYASEYYGNSNSTGVDSLDGGEERKMLTCYSTRYTVAGNGVEDFFGNAMRPENTVEFVFWDSYSPDLLSIRVLTATSIYLSFSEMMAETYAVDAERYSVSSVSVPGSTFDVESAEYLGKHVVLHMTETLTAGEYELWTTGIRDQAGNQAAGVPWPFAYAGVPSGAVIGLYADDQRSGSAVNVEGPYEPFSYYVWCRGSDTGMMALRYAIRTPQRYEVMSITTNEAVVASETGYPINTGYMVILDGCHDGWVWTHRIDCISIAEGEEYIPVIPLYGSGELEITSCLYGNPDESAAAGDSIYLFIDTPLATLLEQWDVAYRHGLIELTWAIAAADNVPGFKVMRTVGGEEDFAVLSSSMIVRDGLDFRVLDTGFQHGDSYRYKVTFSENGKDKILFETGVISTPELPLTLRQNTPNPFNPSTEIFYHLPEGCAVSLDVYDVAGRHIVRLAGGTQTAGDHSVTWNGLGRNGSQVGSGMYFYSLRAGKHELTRKMILLR